MGIHIWISSIESRCYSGINLKIGRVAVLPLVGKYRMGKRGVAVSESSTMRQKPEYHVDFVFKGSEHYRFAKAQKLVLCLRSLRWGSKHYPFTKAQRVAGECEKADRSSDLTVLQRRKAYFLQ